MGPAAPRGPSVEFPMGPRRVIPDGGDACVPCHWSLRWRPPRSAVLGGGDARERCHWGLRWSSL
eukprot:7200206-Pyramimonas_sp.AAC.1